MRLKIQPIERWVPYLGALWFLVVLDSFIVWNVFEPVLRLLAFIGVIWCSLITRKLEYSRRAHILLIISSFFTVWLVMRMSQNVLGVVSYLLDFMPLIFLFFWTSDTLNDTYIIIRKVVIFFAIGGTIVSVLCLTGLISYIPYYVLPPREQLHIMKGVEYHVYGCIPIISAGSIITGRACGMMREPGHMAVILGFVYMIDRFRKHSVNWWVISCGIFTFSSNFFLFVAFTELHYLFYIKSWGKIIKYASVGLASLFLIYLFLPATIKDQVNYLFYERNMEKVVDVLEYSASLDEALDERASKISVSIYDHLKFGEFLFGGVKFDTANSLADYRGLVLQVGFVGVLLSLLFYLVTLFKASRGLMLALFLSYCLIMAHRSWMLRAPYIYFLSFISVILFLRQSNENQLVQEQNDYAK